MLFNLSFEPDINHYIPSKEDCFRLWDKYQMLDNIREHSIMVAKVALFLYEQAKDMNYDVSREYVLAAALLHDIAKTYTIKYGGDHSSLGAAFIREETGNPYLAQAIISHVFWGWKEGELAVNNKPWRLPLMVSHADKRICHCQVVSVDKRFEDLMKRYGTDPVRIEIISADHKQSKKHEKALLDHGFNLNVNHEILDQIIL